MGATVFTADVDSDTLAQTSDVLANMVEGWNVG